MNNDQQYLKKIIEEETPDALHAAVEQLSNIIIKVINGELSKKDAEIQLAQLSALADISANLSGKKIEINDSMISFGNSGQFGDITIGTVTGGHTLNLTFQVIPTGSLNTVEQELQIKAAILHSKLHDYDKALSILTDVLTKWPASRAFIERGRIYRILGNYSDAVKDFSKSIMIADDANMEKTGRFERLRTIGFLLNFSDTAHQWWNEDINWLSENVAENIERGELIYLEAKQASDHKKEMFFDYHTAEQTLNKIQKAIDMGFIRPEVYIIIAECHCGMYNYGLAETSISIAYNSPFLPVWAKLQVTDLYLQILLEMRKFSDIARTIQSMREEDRKYTFIYNIEEEIISRYALEYEYNTIADKDESLNVLRIFQNYFRSTTQLHPELEKILERIKLHLHL